MFFHRKAFTLLCFVAGLSAVSAQDITVECTFAVNIFNEYYCFLQDIEVLDPAVNVTFGGFHIGNRTNEDVEVIVMENSMTPFMIPQMFTTFPSLNDLTIENCGLQSINIPDTVQLLWLDIYRNNVSRISRDSIGNQSSLFFTFLDINNIEEIDEDAFAGIGSAAIYLSLYQNNISSIAPRTFQSLSEVLVIDLEGNSLVSINEEMFSQNLELDTLYLESNQINEVEPSFANNLRNSLSFIGMSGNVCVDGDFTVGSDASWMSLNNALFTCFNNFVNGTDDGSRSLNMNFQGRVRFFDEFGHLVVTV